MGSVKAVQSMMGPDLLGGSLGRMKLTTSRRPAMLMKPSVRAVHLKPTLGSSWRTTRG
jgi:hypothetical protein